MEAKVPGAVCSIKINQFISSSGTLLFAARERNISAGGGAQGDCSMMAGGGQELGSSRSMGRALFFWAVEVADVSNMGCGGS